MIHKLKGFACTYQRAFECSPRGPNFCHSEIIRAALAQRVCVVMCFIYGDLQKVNLRYENLAYYSCVKNTSYTELKLIIIKVLSDNIKLFNVSIA